MDKDSLEICPRTGCCESDACYVTELSPKIKIIFVLDVVLQLMI